MPRKQQTASAKSAKASTGAPAKAKAVSAAKTSAPRPGAPFWETKTLTEMTRAEWESLCDGCGKCCLHKFEYEDTGEVEYTNVACRYLDLKKCNCTQYKRRHELVKDCIALTSKMVGDLGWLPGTCAYRRLDEGKNLPPWHPLITGDPMSVHKAGVAVGGKIVSEDDVDDPEDHIVDWIR